MNMNKNPTISPLSVFSSFWRYRDLIVRMTKREVLGRYRGSVMGLLWSFFNPILMLAIYTFVFSVIFKARWGLHIDSKTEFAILLFAGLIIFNMFSECINRSPNLILNNVNYVKKVIFPLEILPWVGLFSALFHALVSTVILLLFYLLINHSLHWTALYFPVILFPFIFFIMAGSWFLASFGVYVRDVGQAIGVITTIVMFLTPIFYPLTSLPPVYQKYVLYFNPLTFVVDQARNVLVFGLPPHWLGLGIYFVCSVLVAWLGLWWFQKTRHGFADVL